MKILVTGAAGFIGFNFCKYLLSKTEVHDVFGIDNMNNYYDTNLKKMRQDIEVERVIALKAFIKDILDKKFPGPENSVNVEEKVLHEFIKKI